MSARKYFSFIFSIALIFLVISSSGCGGGSSSSPQPEELASPDITPSSPDIITSPDVTPQSPDRYYPPEELREPGYNPNSETSPDISTDITPSPPETSQDTKPAPVTSQDTTTKPQTSPDKKPNTPPAPKPTVSPDKPAETKTTYTASFDTDGGSEVPEQIINIGEAVSEPDEPVKENYAFMGWYPEEGFSLPFDFSKPQSNDITIYAKWYDLSDDVDSDNDGLADSLELILGTDPDNSDTDDDGLTDYDELELLHYNPLSKDTDSNNINDGDEDSDKDGLTNIQEANFNTSMIITDTDNDGLSDYEEVITHHTDPLKPDTDDDGVNDGVEIAIGSDPLTPETVFATNAGTDNIQNNPEAVDLEVIMTSSAGAAGTLRIIPADSSNNVLMSRNMPGFIEAYSIEADGSFDSAVITYTLGDDAGEFGEDFQPRIYYFDEETQIFRPLENQIIDGRKITALVSHFSTYPLLNSAVFEAVFDNDIALPLIGTGDPALDLVFVIDTSGSMEDNDPEYLTVELSKRFVSVLRDNLDRAGVIEFTAYANVLQGLTMDKEALNFALDRIYYLGGTDGTTGLHEALEMLHDSPTENRYIIFLADGEDDRSTTYSYDEIIQQANDDEVTIFTIGMGSANEELLMLLAESTNGMYYHASATNTTGDIDPLEEAYRRIQGRTIDLTKDSNNDGICDYYTDLMNEGVLTLSNTIPKFAGQADNTNPDWDGDGLLNGEEISIIIDDQRKTAYIFMSSDPTMRDTDGDLYNDKQEIENGTSPLHYTFSSEAVNYLADDNNYPDFYRYMTSNQQSIQYALGVMNFRDMAGFITGTPYRNNDRAKEALIEYLGKYVISNDVLSRDIEANTRRIIAKRKAEEFETASAVIGMISSVISFAGKYEKGPDAEDVQNTADTLKAHSDKLLEGKKKGDAVDALIELDKSRAAFMNIYNLAEKWQNNGLANVKFWKAVVKCTTSVLKHLDYFKHFKYTVKNPLLRMTLDVNDWGLLDIATDYLDMKADTEKIAALYGNIEANYSEYQRCLDILRFIAGDNYYSVNSFQNQDAYIHNAANDILSIFNSEGVPEWERFKQLVKDAQSGQRNWSYFEMTYDFVSGLGSKSVPLIDVFNHVVDSIESISSAHGAMRTGDYVVKAQVYYSILRAAVSLLGQNLNEAGEKYYDAVDDSGNAQKYASHLTQARIVGLNSVYDYLSVYEIGDLYLNYTGTMDKLAIRTEIMNGINKTYTNAFDCRLRLSRALPYYTYYTQCRVPIWFIGNDSSPFYNLQ